MKSLAIAFLIILAFLVACQREEPVGETSIIVDEGSTIIVSTQNEELPDEPLNLVERLVENLTAKHNCYVGQTILLEATVAIVGEFGSVLYLETNTDNLWISVNIFPALEILDCDDYYKEAETYVFPLLIETVVANKGRDWREGDPLFFDVYSTLVITEQLKKELRDANWRNADCRDDE